MRATRPNRVCAPDLVGVVLLLGLAAWVTRAVVALGEHGPPLPILRGVR